jgi:uncharacterized protein
MVIRLVPRSAGWLPLLMSLLCGCCRLPAGEPDSGQLGAGDVVVENVQFGHGNDRLAGTLYSPNRPGRRPAVALVLGSGAQDRDYGGVGKAVARHFARSGFVCLTWDKPGVGNSTGDFNTQTFPDRADEALAAVRFLGERPEVRSNQIGLWGHSQGGIVAPLAASMSGRVAFVIEVSGWQGPAWRQDAVRVEAELRTVGIAEADLKEATDFANKRMDLIRGTGPFEDLERAQEQVKDRSWFHAVHRCDRVLFYAARRMVDYDSEPSWQKVFCPVLVIYGANDTSSGPPEPLVAVIRRGLKTAKNEDVTVQIFPDADHSLCSAKASDRKRASQRAVAQGIRYDPLFVSDYLDLMTHWLATKCPPG